MGAAIVHGRTSRGAIQRVAVRREPRRCQKARAATPRAVHGRVLNRARFELKVP